MSAIVRHRLNEYKSSCSPLLFFFTRKIIVGLHHPMVALTTSLAAKGPATATPRTTNKAALVEPHPTYSLDDESWFRLWS